MGGKSWHSFKLSLSPIQQSMIDVFTKALQHPVVISDGWGLIFTRSKVALQLSEYTGLVLLF